MASLSQPLGAWTAPRTTESTDSAAFGRVLSSALVPAPPTGQHNANPELLGPLTEVLGSLFEHTKTNSSLLRELQQAVQELTRRMDNKIQSRRISKRLERQERALNDEVPRSAPPQRETAAVVEAALKVAVLPMERSLQRLEDCLQQNLQQAFDVQVLRQLGDASGTAPLAATSQQLPLPSHGGSDHDDRNTRDPTAQVSQRDRLFLAGPHLSQTTVGIATTHETHETHATHSTHTNATHATHATHATLATHATHATNATHATHATRDSPRAVSTSLSDLWKLRQGGQKRKMRTVVPRRSAEQGWQSTWMLVMREDLQRMEDRCKSLSLSKRALLYQKLGDGISWLMQLREPERTGFWADFVQSQSFESGVAVVIMLNAIVLTADTNYEMRHLEGSSFGFIEIIFSLFYAVELSARLQVHKGYFFIGPEVCWNIYDFILVVLALYDIIFTFFLHLADTGGVAQSLRMIKICRALRIFRLAVFSETRMMFNCVMGSLCSLFSSFMMLGFMFYLFALLFVQTLSHYLMDNSGSDPIARSEIDSAFGSVQLTMFTLYRSVFHGDDWDEYYQVLHERSPISCVLFIFFIGFVQICVANVLSSIFFERAAQVNKPDPWTQMFNESMKQVQEAQHFRSLCSRLDTDGSGTVTVEELLLHIQSESVWAEFLALGLDLRNCDDFFELLLSQKNGITNEVEIDTFVEGCMRMKGSATAMTQQALLLEARTMRHAQAEQNWREKHFHTDVMQRLDAVVSRLNLFPDRKA